MPGRSLCTHLVWLAYMIMVMVGIDYGKSIIMVQTCVVLPIGIIGIAAVVYTIINILSTEGVLQMIDMDLNDDSEKKVVEGVFWNAVDILSEQDRRLPHIHAILPMLKRGVGVHHSGLLPILKEVIEILFQEGLVKV